MNSHARSEGRSFAKESLTPSSEVVQILEGYLDELERGRRPDLDKLLAQQPDFAEPLRACLASLDFLQATSISMHGPQKTGQDSESEAVPAAHQLGEFKLVREIGRGGMGVVYEAEQVALGRRVALKVLPFASVLDKKQLQRFKNEALAAAGLQHQNIVPVYSIGCDRGVHYYVMQLVEGQTLAQVIHALRDAARGARNGGNGDDEGIAEADPTSALNVKKAGRNFGRSNSEEVISATFDCPQAAFTDTRPFATLSTDGSIESLQFFHSVAKFGIQAAEALEYAHSRGVIHRDIKPSNLLVDGEGTVWITDFGLAMTLSDTNLTMSGELLGTLRYMSPEQASGRTVLLDHRSDIYSLGVTLYELLTLQPAFGDQDRRRLLQRVAEDEPIPASKLNHSIPKDLETILLKGMAKYAEDRYQTAQELADDLRRFLEYRPIQARRTRRTEQFYRWVRRNRAVATLTAIVTCLLLFLAIAGPLVAWRQSVLTKTAHQLRQAERRMTIDLALDRGLALCEQGKVGPGMLWLTRTLELASVDDHDLRRVILENLATWQRELNSLDQLFQPSSPVTAIAFNHNGSRIVTGCSDGTVQIWDSETGMPIRAAFRHTDLVHDVAFSRDGSRVLTASFDNTARLWDLATGVCLQTFLHEAPVYAAAFRPGGSQILTGCSSGIVQLWDVVTGNPVGVMVKHPAVVHALAYSPDGTQFATASFDNTAQLWDASTGNTIGQPFRHDGPVEGVAFSNDGSLLLTGSQDTTAQLWDTSSGKRIGQPLKHTGMVHAVAFSPDNSRVLTACFDNTARLWDAVTGEPIGIPFEHEGPVEAIAFSPDGSSVLTGGQDMIVRLWKSGRSRVLASVKHDEAGRGIVFTKDGLYILTRDADNAAWLRNVTTGQPVGKPLGDAGDVRAVSLSVDGTTIVTGREDNIAQLWDANTGKLLGQPALHDAPVWDVAISPDGTRILTGSWDHTARLWTLSGEPKGLFRHESIIWTVTFSPSGSHVLTGGYDGTARLWNGTTGQIVGDHLHHQGMVSAVAISPDGSRILTGSFDNTARLWDAATGKPISDPLRHNGPVWAVAFSPDGSHVLTGGDDTTARMWDVATGKQIGPAFEHSAALRAVAFRTGDMQVVTGGVDGVVRLWRGRISTMKDNVQLVKLRTQVLTGRELDETDSVRALDAETWQERRRQLH